LEARLEKDLETCVGSNKLVSLRHFNICANCLSKNINLSSDVPVWKDIQVPAWKKVWKPKWVEIKVPAWKEIQVPDWKKIWKPV
jgi:Domain of unknown function (DUF4816)